MQAALERAKSSAGVVISSLTARCLAVLMVYSASMIGLFVFVGEATDRYLANAFPSVEVLDGCEDALTRDRFNEIEGWLSDSCQFVIFDAHGGRLYASDSDVAARISSRDLPIINDSDGNGAYYEILERIDERGDSLYEIILCYSSVDDGARVVQSSCLCREDGTIVDGDLFVDRSYLTEHELSLIRGVYASGMKIEKRTYDTERGEGRTLVLVSPRVAGTGMDAVMRTASVYWAAAIVVALLLTGLTALVLFRFARHAAAPLDEAILARKDGMCISHSSSRVPSELLPTYERFAELMDELEAAQADKRRMIADVSHDLKTPLTTIRGYAQAFEEGFVPPEKTSSCLKAMASKASYACELVDSLLIYAKADHPSYEPNLQRTDLCELLRLAVIENQEEFDRSGCLQQIEIPEEPFFAQVDAALLRRAVDNVMRNACAHNSAGTTVAVSCRKEGREAVVSIADDGIGIPPEMHETVFKSFVTSNDARTSGQGTGLGLAIAQKCVQVNGGTISFAEKPQLPFATEAIIRIPLSD